MKGEGGGRGEGEEKPLRATFKRKKIAQAFLLLLTPCDGGTANDYKTTFAFIVVCLFFSLCGSWKSPLGNWWNWETVLVLRTKNFFADLFHPSHVNANPPNKVCMFHFSPFPNLPESIGRAGKTKKNIQWKTIRLESKIFHCLRRFGRRVVSVALIAFSSTWPFFGTCSQGTVFGWSLKTLISSSSFSSSSLRRATFGPRHWMFGRNRRQPWILARPKYVFFFFWQDPHSYYSVLYYYCCVLCCWVSCLLHLTQKRISFKMSWFFSYVSRCTEPRAFFLVSSYF